MTIKNKRAIIIVLDSFGIGELPDAKNFGDTGCDTLGHIDQYCFENNLEFNIPNLLHLGLGRAYTTVNQRKLHCDKTNNHNNTIFDTLNTIKRNNYYGACRELSSGKDTTSGHWEMLGCPVLFDWGYFKNLNNSFPPELLERIVAKSGIGGYLGNCHASGTDIIRDLGDEHIKTNYPIFYTSADSVFQIACHEEHFGLDNLYKLCQIVREELADYNIARVIARPFAGDKINGYTRTGNRKDYSLLPNNKTLLDICSENGGEVVAIGKIGDIYAHQGTTIELKANGLDKLCDTTIAAIKQYKNDKTIIMTNLVDFDMLYGHRRDVIGYKTALEYFNSRIPDIMAALDSGNDADAIGSNDMLILTADHGCDPTWAGSDHTREHIPFLMSVGQVNTVNANTVMDAVDPKLNLGNLGNLGICDTFADIGQTVASHLELPPLSYGMSH